MMGLPRSLSFFFFFGPDTHGSFVVGKVHGLIFQQNDQTVSASHIIHFAVTTYIISPLHVLISILTCFFREIVMKSTASAVLSPNNQY